MPGRSDQNKDIMPMIGEKFAEARKAKGFTQAELAEKLGVTQGVVSDYERGTKRVTAPTLVKIAETLGVTMDELFGLRKADKRAPRKAPRKILRRLEQIEKLPTRDQQALLRTIDAFVSRSRG